MPVIVRGYFNIGVIRKNQMVEQYLNAHASKGFEETVNEVIRECETTQFCLDHFIIKNILIVDVEVLEDQCFSEHFTIVFEWHMRVSPEENMNLYPDFFLIQTLEGLTFSNHVLIGELKDFQIDSNDSEGNSGDSIVHVLKFCPISF